MKLSAKVAISIPGDTLDAVEQVRKKLKLSRSAAVAQALVEWLRRQEGGDSDRAYAEAYLRRPERLDDTAAIAGAAAGAWASWK